MSIERSRGNISTPISTTSNPLDEGEAIYNNPIVQELLKLLPEDKYNSMIEISFPILKKYDDNGRHIIAGYASVDVIDKQKERIPIPVIEDAWSNFKKNKDFYFGSLMHSNIPVIKIIDEYTDKEGQVWKSGVDDNGLFIVAEVRDDIEKGRQTWELIQKGKLSGYSIGGEALSSTPVHEGNVTYKRIDKMELHEVAVVDRPANAPSVFKIIKRDNIVDKNEIIVKDLLIKVNTVLDILLAKETIDKKVVQRGNQWCVIHCSGPDAGKAIKCFDSKADADAMHGAIMANKTDKQDGVPKTVKERLMSHFSLTDEQASKIVDSLGEEKANELLPERGTGFNKQDNRPPKAAWDKCISRASASGSINNPEAFCGNLFYNDRSHFDNFAKGESKSKLFIKKETLSKFDRVLQLLK